ncbi:hypothetical protein HY949_01665 [Candidatus Gottesmanbacteria bacterium]|nr:hypothetical protein [Candidatus Gottesmanbacteria bacterium]
MVKRLAVDCILIVFLFLFSWWLMTKSFGYDPRTSQFRVARHEVGDFGLHIGLIRSFAWGENVPAQSPFFPGAPLVYHYAVDWIAGQLVRAGIRIDYALNGISATALTIFLYGLYRLTKLIARGSRGAGVISILLFLLPSNLSFIEMVRRAPKDGSFFSYFWRFPDYIHQGPFDGSMITIYTTLSPYLNQRHLIAGMMIAVVVLWIMMRWMSGRQHIPDYRWMILGLVVGAATRVHIVIALATGIVAMVFLIGKRNRALMWFGTAAVLFALPHLSQILSVKVDSALAQFWNPGYLSSRPLSAQLWVQFWVQNLGFIVFLLPLAYRHADDMGRRLMIGAGILFAIANTMQVSFRIEHNHTLINFAVFLVLPGIAHLLVSWWNKRRIAWKIIAVGSSMLLTVSGLVNLMVVKNDYQATVDDVARSGFMQWIRTSTDPSSIVLSYHALYDPVVLTGRKNYLGMEYYVTVMGYDYWGRRKQIDGWLASFDRDTATQMKQAGIDYIAIPVGKKDFPYTVDEKIVQTLLPITYQEETITVYEL